MPAAAYDHADHLDLIYESRNPSRRWQHCSRRDWMIEALNRTVPRRLEHVIEVGAGSGVYLPALSQHGDKVTVVDINPQCVARLQERITGYNNVTVIEDDITKSALSPSSVDLVLCSQVIEHIPDPQAAIEGMSRILKPGGLLLIGTPQKWSSLETIAKIALSPAMLWLTKLVYRESAIDTGHISLMTRRELQEKLTNCGFEIIEQHISGFYIPVVAELMGETGLAIAQFVERKLRGTPLDWLHSTQAYVVRKSAAN